MKVEEVKASGKEGRVMVGQTTGKHITNVFFMDSKGEGYASFGGKNVPEASKQPFQDHFSRFGQVIGGKRE